jgi:surfeit locus 1 family protein
VLRALLSPRMIGLHVLAVVAVTATVLLGLWQYGAWQLHREDKAAVLATARPVPLHKVMSADDPFPGDAVGQPVRFTGSWLPASTMFVDHRRSHGQEGYWVVTPVAVCGAGPCSRAPAMLVVRGWTPDPSAAPPSPRGPAHVTGWLQPGEGAGIPDPDTTDDVLPELRIASAIQHVDQDLYGGYVISRDAGAGLARVTPASLPAPSSFTALRNLLYALEWWVFGGFAVFIWWRWCRDEVTRVSAVEAGAPDASAAGVASKS